MLGITVGWATTFVLATISTGLIAGNRLADSSMSTVSVITMVLSGFLSAVVAGAKVGQRRILVCGCVGTVYFVILLCCNALFFDGKYRGVLGGALTILGSALVASMLKKGQQKHKVRYFKNRHNI